VRQLADLNWARAPYRELGEDTCFAAPAIGHDQSGKIISQTPAAAQWLGTECGFAPAASLAAEAMKAALDIADLWAEAYGKRQKAGSWAEVEEFLSGRGAKFFGVLEATAAKYGKGTYMIGSTATYVDFLLVNIVDTMEFIFGKERMAPVLAASPKVSAAVAAVLALDGVAAAMSADPVLYPPVKYDGTMPMS